MGVCLMSSLLRIVQRLSAVLILLAASPIYAQSRPDPNLDPTYGAVTLAAGFNPDPVTKEVQAGGELTTKLGGVSAHVAKAPDFRLNFTAGNSALVFTVKSVG